MRGLIHQESVEVCSFFVVLANFFQGEGGKGIPSKKCGIDLDPVWFEREGEMGQVRDRRPDALGGFRVLPDELVCSIIATMPPRTVGTLACVSR